MSLVKPPEEPALADVAELDCDVDPLFEPFDLGSVRLANRFVMPGMQRALCSNGAPTAELAEYYRRRAEGGVAMIISESTAIDHPSASAQPSACRIAPDTLEAWSRCVEGVRANGAQMLLQLWHEGGRRKNLDGHTVSPSGLGYPGLEQGRAMSAGDLEEIRDAYVASARLAAKAGATGIELHAAHGYFLDQFLWADTNLRDDGYGGSSVAARARFPAEIVSAVRDACGADFLISVRFSQWKEHDYTARIVETPEELAVLTGMFREAGADVLHVSTRRFWIPEWQGSARGFAGWARHVSGMPTITVGSVGLNKDVMESLTTDGGVRTTIPASLRELTSRLGKGEFDLVAVGRSLIADPDWVRKVRSGDFAAITPFSRSLLSRKWEF